MEILLVSATSKEINPLYQMIKEEAKDFQNEEIIVTSFHRVRFLVTGVGGVATAASLSAHLSHNKYDLAINMGIAGAFSEALNLGDVVSVGEDRFGDFGIEEADGSFSDLFAVGLSSENEFPFENGKLGCTAAWSSLVLPQVRAITVNKVHGNDESIERIKEKFNPDIETMEGAAFYYSCHLMHQPCVQIRSISNKVERRNRENWNIPLALKNLTDQLFYLLTKKLS